MIRRSPSLAEEVGDVTQPSLRCEPLVRQALPPTPHQVQLGPRFAHRGVDQPRQAIVRQDRHHVVLVAHSREVTARELATVRRVVQEALIWRACRHEFLELGSRRRVHLVVRPLADNHRHAFRQAHHAGVRIDEHGGAIPKTKRPQAAEVRPTLRRRADDIRLEGVDPGPNPLQVWPRIEVGLLRIRQALPTPIGLKAGLFDHHALARVHLSAEARPDDHDPLRTAIRLRVLQAAVSCDPLVPEVRLEVREVKPFLPPRHLVEYRLHHVKGVLFIEGAHARPYGQYQLRHLGGTLHRVQ
mmetsp:Transcript_86692/g.250374  ORF Transcript_86692/g.250374 Transcript_86692/m.250374 type:complete len:299 (-) Transcript_86692:791-1687(-)